MSNFAHSNLTLVRSDVARAFSEYIPIWVRGYNNHKSNVAQFYTTVVEGQVTEVLSEYIFTWERQQQS